MHNTDVLIIQLQALWKCK